MLRDIERKVLRIICNYNAGRRRMPTLHELNVKTGRPERELQHIINRLQEQTFLEWDGMNPNTIFIMRGWEDWQSPRPTSNLNRDYSRFLN